MQNPKVKNPAPRDSQNTLVTRAYFVRRTVHAAHDSAEAQNFSKCHTWRSLMDINNLRVKCVLWTDPGGHSNTSVVHMRDQRFSKHTLTAISPLQGKHPLNENLA